MIDFTTEFGKRAESRLNEDHIIWLTSVDTHGKPQPRPVWFLWEAGSILIYSRPQTHKVHHIVNNPQVSLNFNSDHYGGDIVVFLGEAQIPQTPVPEDMVTMYFKKYAQGMKDLGMTADDFRNSYSLPIIISPISLRGH